MCEYTTIRIDKKDTEFLEKNRKRLRKRSMGDIVHSMIELIKQQKSENELK